MRKALLLTAGLVVALACPSGRADEDKDKDLDIVAKLKKAKVEGPFVLAVLFKVKEGEEKALLKAARPCIAATRKEKGCLAYELNQELDNPRQFVFYEKWKSVAALEEHLKSEHVKALLAAMHDIADGPPTFHTFRPIGKAE